MCSDFIALSFSKPFIALSFSKMILEVDGSIIVVNSKYSLGLGMGMAVPKDPGLDIYKSCPMTEDEMCMLQVNQGMLGSTAGALICGNLAI